MESPHPSHDAHDGAHPDPAAALEYDRRVEGAIDELKRQLQSARPSDPVAFVASQLTRTFSGIGARSGSGIFGDEGLSTVQFPPELMDKPLTIVVFGASGDLARKKTFPALFRLFADGLLPPHTLIVGYARTQMERSVFSTKVSSCFHKADDPNALARFTARLHYCHGQYDSAEDLRQFDERLRALEKEAARRCATAPAALNPAAAAAGAAPAAACSNRVFYLALPPSAFVGVCTAIKASAVPEGGWIRIVVEKPFGSDTETSLALSKSLGSLFNEKQLFRIDHYLGKEMVQNIVTLRFANHVFSALWNRCHIASVQVTFKETIGTEGRGGYFDSFGIIRDVMQNHLTQILALIAMEKPKSLDPESIRDEKVAVLRCVEPVAPEDCVIGQYTADAAGKNKGYLDDPTVPKGSRCPTFAAVRLMINNDRWQGVPFIMKAGKALERKMVVVRIQFRDEVRPFLDRTQRNELVIRAQPDEAMYLKISTKVPGMGQEVHQTELDLSYGTRYSSVRLPDAYESLINEVVLGNATNFVRSDELDAAWRIFTPLLHAIDGGQVQPYPYEFGTRGPKEADEMLADIGYKRTAYAWQAPVASPKL